MAKRQMFVIQVFEPNLFGKENRTRLKSAHTKLCFIALSKNVLKLRDFYSKFSNFIAMDIRVYVEGNLDKKFEQKFSKIPKTFDRICSVFRGFFTEVAPY